MISTPSAGKAIAGVGGCREVSYSGLKDACSASWQHFAVRCPRAPPRIIEAGRVKAWLLGVSGRLVRGSHDGNLFRVALETRDPASACSNIEAVDWIPGFYGPQRFGVERPNSHLYGYYLARGDLPGLVREALYRYPGESRGCPGYYEKRLARSPWKAEEVMPRIVLEALQSYIFNRALSMALERGSLSSIAEGEVVLGVWGNVVRLPAVRLPHSSLAGRGTEWARLVERVTEEEGLDLKLFSTARGLKPSLRPVRYPVLKVKCREGGPWDAWARMALPPGGYATIAVWRALEVDWLRSYEGCNL